MLKIRAQGTRGEHPTIDASLDVTVVPAPQERLGARLTQLMESYCYWLTGRPVTERDRTVWEIRCTEALLRSVTNGLVWHLDGLVSERSCCLN